MRATLLILVLSLSTAAGAHSISDEFAAGYGGVSWGMKLGDLIRQFPGGYQIFSTAPGGLAYVLNIEDPVLGIPRRGLYVSYGIGVDGTVDYIEVQIPYDQATALISTITAKFGPVIGPEVRGVVSNYRWPTDQGIRLGVRIANGGAPGLATLAIWKLRPKPVALPKAK
jgi:hypothetical protein